ncbi:MAG: restriction endonuclease [Desulfofustis sp.]|nr:restriction endonuclease [Desulfofustis sp.]
MARRKESIFDVFTEITWQTSIFLAALVFIILRFILPLIPIREQLLAGIVETLREHAHLIGLVLLIPVPFSAFAARKRQNRLTTQRDINSIRDLDRWQVEQLVAETYRRRGYTVMFEQDGDLHRTVDLRLQKGGKLRLLQCRHWQSLKVDVSDVRELYETMAAEKATGGIVITSGAFTPEAKKLSAAKAIELIDLEQFAALTRDG